MIRKITCTVAIACMLITPALAQSKDEAAVAAAVESLRKAMIDPDKATLEKLASPDLSYGHSLGKIENRAEFIDALVSKRSDFVTIELTEQTVKVTGNTAIVRNKLSATTNDNGNPGTVKLTMLLVYIKQNKEWKLLARQAVRPPQQ